MNGKINLETVLGFIDAVPLLKPRRNKMVACWCVTFVALVAVCRIFGGGSGEVGDVGSSFGYKLGEVPEGADSPKEIVERYYKAYKDGDPVAFLNCVDYTYEEKLCMIGPLAEKMAAKDWRKKAEAAYSKVKYEREELRPYDADLGCEWGTANAYVEASDEYEGSNKRAGRLWNMKKIDGKWFINKDSDVGAHWMGLTDLATPF